MKYSDVTKLSPDELRVKCAELEGWKIEATWSGRPMATKPDGRVIYRDFYNIQQDVIKDAFPDYSQPTEYMRLMGLIWEKDSGAVITKKGVSYTFGNGGYCDGIINDDLAISIAIQRAFLVIVGGEK